MLFFRVCSLVLSLGIVGIALSACNKSAPVASTTEPVEVIYDHTTFADAGLERAVRQSLAQPRGELNVDQFSTLVELRATSMAISALVGIEKLAALRQLYLGDNALEDIAPLSALRQLQILDLSRNQVRDLMPL